MPKKNPASSDMQLALPLELIERRIHVIRGQKVMLDSDLAKLYQVPTRRLKEQVKRNRDRFPEDFMLQLTNEETESLRSQIATLEKGRGRYSKYAPYAFTEHGVAMLSSVLSSTRAVQMNIVIIWPFVKLREVLATNKDLAARMEKIEATQKQHGSIITVVVEEIKKLRQPGPFSKRRIGFHTGEN